MVEHVADGLAQSAVGFHLVLIQLFTEPGVKVLHQRHALVLMKTQTFMWCHVLLFGNVVILIDRCQCLEHMPALLREGFEHIYEPPAAMGQTVGQKGFKLPGCISGKGITHLDRGAAVQALFEQIFQVLTSMLTTRKEQRDFMIVGG